VGTCHFVNGSEIIFKKKKLLIFFKKKNLRTNDKVTRVNFGTRVTLSLTLGFFFKKNIIFFKINLRVNEKVTPI